MIVLEHWLAKLLFRLSAVLITIYIADGVLRWWLGRKLRELQNELRELQNEKATLLELEDARRRRSSQQREIGR